MKELSEIIQLLADSAPLLGDIEGEDGATSWQCKHCRVRMDWPIGPTVFPHDDDCIWLLARKAAKS